MEEFRNFSHDWILANSRKPHHQHYENIQKKESWITNVMKILSYIREQAEQAYIRIFHKDL